MKKIQKKGFIIWFTLIVIFLLQGYPLGLVLAKAPNVSGHIVLRKGKTVDFIKLVYPEDKYLLFKYGPQDKETRIPLARVKTVSFGEKSESARIVLKDGRKIKGFPLDYDEQGCPEWQKDQHFIVVYYFDDIAKTERKEAYLFKNISRIVIGNDAGSLRKCPHCRAIWPEDYLFCPHDGEKTVWVD